MFYSINIRNFAAELIFIVEQNIIIVMEKKNNPSQTLCIEELVKQRPILTEEEMAEFCTYEEIVADAKSMLDKEVQKIWREYDSRQSK